jgi:hypothetical protein
VYEAHTGNFFWKRRPAHHFRDAGYAESWNARYAGTRAFTETNEKGYRRGEVLYRGRRYKLRAGRVALLMAYGIEAETVDHINQKRDDDRLVNLRPATNSENAQNRTFRGPQARKLRGTRSTGQKWVAYIKHDGRRLKIGLYDTEIEAHRAYEAAAKRLRGDFYAARSVSSVA